MSERVTAVSVDLDDLACYHAIHGLSPPSRAQQGLVLERCLPRFLELFETLGVRATFFVIGRDLQRDLEADGRGADLLRQAVAAGHELGNHSHAHAYDLVRWPADAILSDLRACDRRLRELGAVVHGFRAPGYTHDANLLHQVEAVGYRYDSSALPSPSYYALKLAAIGMTRLTGRRSQSLLTGASSFFGPREPYRRRDADLWEFPMSVAGPLGLPLIGTTLLSAPEPVGAMLRRWARRLDYFHLELHGIDLADPDADEFAPALLRRQPELRVALVTKLERLRRLLSDRGPAKCLHQLVP